MTSAGPTEGDAQVSDVGLAEGLDRVGALAGPGILHGALEGDDALSDADHRTLDVDRLAEAEADGHVEEAGDGADALDRDDAIGDLGAQARLDVEENGDARCSVSSIAPSRTYGGLDRL